MAGLDGFLKYLGTVSVALFVIAAGLVFEARYITLAGLGLLSVVTSVWLLVKLHPAFTPGDRFDRKKRQHKLVDWGRSFAVRYTQQRGEKNFTSALETWTMFPEMRPHLSAEFLRRLNAPRTSYAKADGTEYESLVTDFLAEMDRLEKKWGVGLNEYP